MSYRTGMAAVQEAIERKEEEAAARRNGVWLGMFGWDGKKTPQENRKIVRFLTDKVITIGVHEYVMGRDGKKNNDIICSMQLREEIRRPCEICDTHTYTYTNRAGEKVTAKCKPREMTFGLGVLRKEVWGEQDGRKAVVGYEDWTWEVQMPKPDRPEDSDETVPMMVPWFGIIKQAHSNFWSIMTGYHSREGTLINIDYEISRRGDKGGEGGTVYTILPCEPDPKLHTSNEAELLKHYPLLPETLEHWIERKGSEERYNRVLHGPMTNTDSSEPSSTSSTPVDEGATQPEDTGPVVNSGTQFGSLRERLAQASNTTT